MRIGLALLLLCVIAGCVTQQYDRDGNPINRELERELVRDEAGRIVGRPTRLIAPHTIIINGGTPTEREIRLLAVEGLPRSEAPVTYAKIQEYMRRYIAEEEEIFIRPAIDANLSERVIYGLVYLYALDPETGLLKRDGYVNVNQAMLSQGLVKIRDIREVEDPRLRQSMQAMQEYAQENKLGLWSDTP